MTLDVIQPRLPRTSDAGRPLLSTLHSPLSTTPAPAFTFIEVLFAIIILGIGSIMIAGMLPVAIKQSSDTRNAITGKAACEAGYAYVQTVVSSATSASGALPDSSTISVSSMTHGSGLGTSAGRMVPLTNDVLSDATNLGTALAPGPLYGMQSITGSRVLTSDPRTQWLAFYGRAPGAAAAKLVVLALHLNNVEAVSGYVQTTPTAVNTLTRPENGPFLVNATIVDGGALDADKITLEPGDAGGMQAAESGAFVIVADSPVVGTDTGRPARNNGRVFRLGKFVSGSATSSLVYELDPAYDLPPAQLGADGVPNTADDVADASMSTGTTTQVWLVGRGLQNPAASYNASSNPYVGLTQDVGVLTTQVQLSN